MRVSQLVLQALVTAPERTLKYSEVFTGYTLTEFRDIALQQFSRLDSISQHQEADAM